MNNIERAIQAYNANQISLDELRAFLNFKDWDTINKQNIYNKRVMLKLVDAHHLLLNLGSPNPEDLFIECEYLASFDNLLNNLQKLCSDRDFEIYIKFFSDKAKQADLAEEYDLSRSAISMIILRVNVKIRKYLSRHPEHLSLFKEFLCRK